MRFDDAALQAQADALRTARKPADRAYGDNFRFEERVADPRRQAYEAALASLGAGDLSQGHAKYIRKHVKPADPATIPASFQPANAGALLPALPDQEFVRVEDIGWFADQWRPAGSGQALIADLLARRHALQPGEAVLLDQFIAFWNEKRDGRPLFAALVDEVAAAAGAADWAVRLRAQLGLGHLAPLPGKPLLLVQLRYSVADVRRHARPGQHAMFAAPTVLDSDMSPYFYPAPAPPPGLAGSCGRTLHLDNTPPLVAELLTSRIEYRLDHIRAVTWLADPLPSAALPPGLPALRNGHLARIRAALACPGFAEPMAAP